MKANGLLLFTLLLAACDRQEAPTPAPAEQPAASQSRAAPPVAVSSAQRFWSTFREAALGQDLSALQPMTRFPFVTRGATDELKEPRLGAITVIKKKTGGADKATGSSSGFHVAFFVSAAESHIRLLGGNQSDSVKYSNFALSKYDIKSHRWPT